MRWIRSMNKVGCSAHSISAFNLGNYEGTSVKSAVTLQPSHCRVLMCSNCN